jgi:hypothetical protein
MYNLLVSGNSRAWENGSYQYDKSRFLEYTNEDIASGLKGLHGPQIEILKSYPCLFAYEGEESDVRIGYLNSIQEVGRKILIEFEFQQDIDPIPFEKIRPIESLLDIRRWEMGRTHWAVKDEDLFARLRAKGVLDANQEAREIRPELPRSEESRNRKVKQVQAFIGRVLARDGKKGHEFFYRGHSNRNKYKLVPSLFRKDSEGNYLYKYNEDIIYRELLVSNSADFQSDVYTLDKLVRMQHYSLPTRLLDITSNPLVALYFACKSSPDEDGEVIEFAMERNAIKYFDSDVASCIANLARLPQAEKEKIEFDGSEFNDLPPIQRLLSFIRQEKPFFEARIIPNDLRDIICVKAKQSNDRVTAQSGAFLLYGMDAEFDENGTQGISVSRIAITNKESILNELDLLNINESTVFPYIETSAKYVAEKFRFKKPMQPTLGGGVSAL